MTEGQQTCPDSTPTPLDPEVAAGTWVIIPVFNEASVISNVIGSITPIFPNVVAVDDGSSDDTWSELRVHYNSLAQEARADLSSQE